MSESVIERSVDLGFGAAGPMAVFALAGLTPAALSEPALIEAIGSIDEQVAWLHALRAGHLAELARRHADDPQEPEAPQPGQWRSGRDDAPQWERESIGLRCAITGYEARTRLQTATALETRLPVTARLLAAGAISWPHAVALAQETADLDEPETRRIERTVHADRRALTAGQVRRATHRLALARRPPHDAANPERSLVAWREGPGVCLQAQLTAEGGATVATCLDALATRTDPADDRPIATRRADALVELCRTHLDTATLPPTAAGTRPHLTLTVPLSTLPGTDDQPATTTGAGPFDLPAETARRLAWDAGITLLTHTDHVLHLGREHRFPTPALRRRLEARDHGCRFPTCTRPAHRTHAHHIRHWAHGGPTDETNLLLVCSRHHHLLHEGRWQLTVNGTTTTWTTPHGHTYDGPPPLARPPHPDEPFYAWLPDPPTPPTPPPNPAAPEPSGSDTPPF